MLGKLIKHEWKSIGKVGGMMLLAMLVVTIIGCILIQVTSIGEMFTNDNVEDVQVIGMVFGVMTSVIIYMLMLCSVTYGMFIYLGVRFYKTMYTDEGYLIHTLPVTAHQILGSKLLVSGLWYLFITAAIVISVFTLIFSAISGMLTEFLAEEGIGLWEAIGEIIDEIAVAYEEIGFDLVRYGITMVILLLLGPFSGLMTLFGALTIGQLSRKYKALMGILVYFGLMLINMVIAMIVQMVVTINQTVNIIANPNSMETFNMNATYDASMIISIAMGAIMYVVSYLIITKKLNLD